MIGDGGQEDDGQGKDDGGGLHSDRVLVSSESHEGVMQQRERVQLINVEGSQSHKGVLLWLYGFGLASLGLAVLLWLYGFGLAPLGLAVLL